MSANVTIMGRLGADPEIRFTKSGTSVASFSLVSSKSSKRDDGGWDESETTWYRVDAWDRLGENVTESLRKGDAVVVVGRLYMDTYTGRDGAERQSLKVTAYSVGPDLKRGAWAKREAALTAPAATDDPWGSSAPQDDIPPF